MPTCGVYEARCIDKTKRSAASRKLLEARARHAEVTSPRNRLLNSFWPFSRRRHLVADSTVGRVARDMPAAQWVDPCWFRRGLVDRPVLTLAGMLDEPGLLETLER